jgi:hypothetical protein
MKIRRVGKIAGDRAARARRAHDFADADQPRGAPLPSLPRADEVIE